MKLVEFSGQLGYFNRKMWISLFLAYILQLTKSLGLPKTVIFEKGISVEWRQQASRTMSK